MRKFKKSISALLAFVMLMSAMLCNLVVSVSAAETTTIEKGKSVSYAFGITNGQEKDTGFIFTGYNGTEVVPYQASDGLDSYNSDDGYVSMSGKMNVNEAGNIHALLFKSDSEIIFTVAGDATISLGLCQYNVTGNQTITVEAENGNVEPSSFDNDGSSDGDAQTITYTGDGGTITIDIPSGTYIHSLGITVDEETVAEDVPTAFAEEWDFSSSDLSGENGTKIEGTTGEVTQGDAVLKIDATSGKWDSTATNGWVQVNANTIIYVPVAKGTYTISVTTYKTDVSLTIDGVSVDSGSDKTASVTITNESARYVAIVMGGSDYIGSITVKAVEEEEPVEEEVPTAFAKEWNFRSGSDLIGDNGVEIQGTTGEVVQSDAVLKIDATSGKWNTKDRTDYAQVNAGTIIKVPVDAGIYTISVTTYSEDKNLTIDGVSVNSGSDKIVYSIVNNEEARYVSIVMEDDDYIGVISITEETANEVEITFTDTGNLLGNEEVIFVDTLTNLEYERASSTNKNVSLLVGHTYKLKTTNSDIRARVNNSSTFTMENVNVLTVAIENNPNVTLSGNITSEDNGLTKDDIKSLTFVDMEDDENVYYATVSDDLTYSAQVKEGSYNTVAVTTNNFTTSNRVDVGESGVTNEEVYFSKATSLTYYLPDDIKNETQSLTYNGFSYNNSTSISGSAGATITVPVNGKQKVTVAGWYSGTWNINGTNAVTATNSNNASNPATNSYVTDGTETSVTVTVTSEDTAYLYWIEVEDVVECDYDISVPGDYSTLTKAIDAIGKMDRPDGEEGRVTITLTADLQEQVLVDTPYVSIIGNGHTISWYYGTTAKYYSVDDDGYYSEDLFRDKYELSYASGTLWGGVVIVTGDHFYAEDVTFLNTYNYEVTEKEIEDGATQDVTINNVAQSVVRTKDTEVTAYAYKERANALYTNANYIECYKVNILSSQDTLGVNGEKAGTYAYFRECTIGGNVDYICGGGNMVFDDCTLELYGYSDKSNAGYITAAKGTKYLFRNCEVTGNDNDNSTQATAYYGRPWKNANDTGVPDVKFINTQTNGRIVDDGWHDWSNGATVEEVNFGEYCNLNDTVEFKSTYYDGTTGMTDEDYNEVINSIESEYLGGWTPVHYVSSVAVNNDEVLSGSAIEFVKINNGSDLLVYGYVDSNKIEEADEIGFVFSTLNNLFNKETIYTDKNVYGKITYTDDNGNDVDIVAPEGTYLFGYVVEGVNLINTSEVESLFAKIVQTTNGNRIYGAAVEIQLDSSEE